MTDQEKIMAALPVIQNGLRGDLDPMVALEWVLHILTKPATDAQVPA